MALKVFEVEVTVTRSARFIVLAESEDEIDDVGEWDWKQMTGDDDDVEVCATARPKTPPSEAEYIVRDGDVEEITAADIEEAEGEVPVVDTATLPLALPYCNKRGKVLRVERVEGVPFYPLREGGQ